MNDRHMRDFYRFRMTAATAKLVVQFMVDATLEIHVTKCEGSRYRLKDNPEYWQERCNRAHGPLNLARLIENTVVIGSDKANRRHVEAAMRNSSGILPPPSAFIPMTEILFSRQTGTTSF